MAAKINTPDATTRARRCQPNDQTDPQRKHALLEHEPENVARRCANRHPNSNLLRAPAHRMRNHRIQANRSK
jgi:hypothetical protein